MIEKATHVTIFWNLARNPEKNSSKIRRKNAKFEVFAIELVNILFFFLRHNGPAPARPLQEGRFWKRSETRKRILRVAQKTQIKSALQELLESLPDRMWKESMRSKCAKTEDTESPVSEYVCL